MRPPRACAVRLCVAFGLLAACAEDPPLIDRTLAYEDIDPAIYFTSSAGDDPFAEVYEGFRERRAEHMADPERPPPIEPYAPVHQNADKPWDAIDVALPFEWDGVDAWSPGAREHLEATLRTRRIFDHPDLKITQMMLGPGARLPLHAGGAPGVMMIVGGTADVTVEGEAWTVSPGARIKLEPYAVRAVSAGGEPFKWLWIRWAPGGDHRYIQAGYYLTGANQHVQPAEATLPGDYEFWGDGPGNVAVDGAAGGAPTVATQRAALEAVREELGPDSLELYPDVAVFGHERDVPWLDLEALQTSNLMWAKDVLSTGAMLERWAEVVRMESVFQARRPDGTWDFNISQQAWGSGARYVEHSHSIPEFYYMLSGRVEHWNGGQRYDAVPGDVFMTNSYQTHESWVRPGGEVWRSYGATWPPNGDRTVFERPFFLLEEVGTPADGSKLASDVAFH